MVSRLVLLSVVGLVPVFAVHGGEAAGARPTKAPVRPTVEPAREIPIGPSVRSSEDG
ncbi:hypothetical protein B0I31_101570 [Saccharothrix carnea]|uniref:Uncharacterized protein n=1 Tax=Saccharothrix carnea TaxID=1280637 RepID=A0A2P8IIQ5_SACCR|nr:hypothetical protein [Saccharothrix carnea]PSL58352.1 hypothetical protein B0I31_101570 [Saccharothrix carnea]